MYCDDREAGWVRMARYRNHEIVPDQLIIPPLWFQNLFLL